MQGDSLVLDVMLTVVRPVCFSDRWNTIRFVLTLFSGPSSASKVEDGTKRGDLLPLRIFLFSNLSERVVEEGERMLEVLQRWGQQRGEVRYVLHHLRAPGRESGRKLLLISTDSSKSFGPFRHRQCVMDASWRLFHSNSEDQTLSLDWKDSSVCCGETVM